MQVTTARYTIQAAMSEELAQGLYVAARVGFKPATLQMQQGT